MTGIRRCTICRRVSLINYKGGSGRILGAKLNKKNQNHHQKIIFSTKFANVRKIKKWMWRKIQNTKSWKSKKKMFLNKISPKMNFGDRNCNFQSLRGHENITKSPVNNNASIFQPQNPKTYWPFLGFSCTRTDHLTWPIDRARSQLFRTFFLASLRSF